MPPELVAIFALFTLVCLTVGLAMSLQSLAEWWDAMPCPRCGSAWTDMVSGERIDGKELWLCRGCCHGWAVYPVKR